MNQFLSDVGFVHPVLDDLFGNVAYNFLFTPDNSFRIEALWFQGLIRHRRFFVIVEPHTQVHYGVVEIVKNSPYTPRYL